MNAKYPKIGLALSGGGFRASLFHLGVIRRLEELGIMRNITVISSVSGGSIIAAYYLVEMERRLRSHKDPEAISARVEIFEAIAKDFIDVLDHNLRSKAIIFTPFYHPLAFVKTLLLKAVRSTARSELIQTEYDKRFYHNDTLDQLPSVNVDQDGVIDPSNPWVGPTLVLNTTSLLTGQRVGFSRVPQSDIKTLATPDTNFIRLSKIVGASAGVPVIFPPTAIRGDLLVDGGISDNQGIEGLKEHDCEVYIVSDASGQMEAADIQRTSEAAVYARVNSIFQFQIRQKLLRELEGLRDDGKEVAFIHLFVNLKDREAETRTRIPRISSELIPALARIRTDLDQFSPVEREALMYHGYTAIDSEIATSCHKLKSWCESSPMRTPPLFAGQLSESHRKVVRKDLEAGRSGLFLVRSYYKYRRVTSALFVVAFAAWIASVFAILHFGTPVVFVAQWFGRRADSLLPTYVKYLLGMLLGALNLPQLSEIVAGVSMLLGFLAVISIPLYIIIFVLFVLTRRIGGALDRKKYTQIAGEAPTTRWSAPDLARAKSV